LAQANNDLAGHLISTGEFEEALSYLDRALVANLGEAGDSIGVIRPRIGLAEPASGEQLFVTLEQRAKIYQNLYRRELRLELLHSAFETYQQAAQHAQQHLRQLPTEVAQLDWVERTHPLYEPAIAAALQLHRLTGEARYQEAAFGFAEQGRGSVLASSITASRARQYAGIPDSLLARETDVRLRLTYYTRSLKEEESKRETADSAKVALWKNKVFDLKREYESIITRFEREYPAYYKLKHQVNTASVAEVQQVLAEHDDTLLEYAIGEDSLYAFVVTSDDFQVVTSAIDSTLRTQIESMRQAIVTHDLSAYRSTAHTLYQRLLAPVAPLLRTDHVTIVPDAALSYVPFEALLSSAGEEGSTDTYRTLPYVVHTYSVSYAYSSTLYADSRSNGSEASGQFVAYAPVFTKGLFEGSRGADLLAEYATPPKQGVGRGFLPATFEEVMGIARLFEISRGWLGRLFGTKTRVYLEDEAVEASIRESLKDYRFVHLATHAFVNDEDPWRSGIVLLDDTTGGHDGVLELSEIYNLELDAELVTLSACQTGLGRDVRGEGLIGLTRGFLYAGAQSVLVSLWNVQDQATADLMTRFYGDVLAGRLKAEALQEAKRQLIASSERYADPFYWSAFVLNGR
jgi:CHAT domain-containing protein